MNLKRYRKKINNILENIDEEIADLMETADRFAKSLAWAEHVATLKAGDELYRKPCNTPYVKWKGRNVVIAEINTEDDLTGGGVAVKEVGSVEWVSVEWYEPAKAHCLRIQVVANGAGKGVCECGNWESPVSDDGLMFTEDYYSPEDIKKAYEKHLKEVING